MSSFRCVYTQQVTLRFLPEAVQDLRDARYSGRLHLIFKKLRMIERDPSGVGLPLRHPLTMFRKVVLGDRTWRIVYRPAATPNGDGTTDATVWVIGDRADDACYEEAKVRLERLGNHPDASVALDALAKLLESRKKQRELDES
jgi:mRNA interferase RelE/StbE